MHLLLLVLVQFCGTSWVSFSVSYPSDDQLSMNALFLTSYYLNVELAITCYSVNSFAPTILVFIRTYGLFVVSFSNQFFRFVVEPSGLWQ